MPAHLRPDREHVAEAVVRDQAGAGQPPLDDGVRRHRRTVGEVVDVACCGACPLEQAAQAVHEPGLDPLRRRTHLGDPHPAVVGHDDGVGECPSHVDSDPSHPWRRCYERRGRPPIRQLTYAANAEWRVRSPRLGAPDQETTHVARRYARGGGLHVRLRRRRGLDRRGSGQRRPPGHALAGHLRGQGGGAADPGAPAPARPQGHVLRPGAGRRAHPDRVREILADGHEVGHHGYTHTSPVEPRRGRRGGRARPRARDPARLRRRRRRLPLAVVGLQQGDAGPARKARLRATRPT